MSADPDESNAAIGGPLRDRNGLVVLDQQECLRLLASVPIARVALAINAIPVVFPVNFVLDGDEIIIRSAEGTKLDAALGCAVVAVEADEYDPVDHSGWSVVVKGRARELTDQKEVQRAAALPLRPWGAGGAHHYLAVSTELVSGRRVVPLDE
jgi:nitroimidazol reductase NimA-like FMN-containing flavoprotein (pyridoxamine 5'-phosphate oxidase superfamily)